MSAQPSVAQLIERALAGFDRLAEMGLSVGDEWQYVTDLDTVWRARLRAVAEARGAQPAPPGAPEAVEALIGEAERIADLHRAIDWLSTCPQVTLAALGEAS